MGAAVFGLSTSVFGLAFQPPGLSAAQRDSLDRGELIAVTEPRDGSAWPAITVRLFIAATPQEAAAVFIDYESHSRTLPNIKKARISKTEGAAITEVDYTLEVPIVSDEDYTVRNAIARDPRGGYRVDWTMLRATSTRATVGHASFLPYETRSGKRGTLLEYENFVTPGSRMAGIGIIRSRAMTRVRETARAIRTQVEAERGDRTLMNKRLGWLTLATDK